MKLSYSQHIAAPPETVFAFLDDDEKRKLWMEGVEQTSYPEGKPAGDPVGTRFREVIREGKRLQEYEGEILAYDKPRHLGVKIEQPGAFSVLVDYRLTAEDVGTRLDYRCELSFANCFYKVMGYLFGWLSKRILRKQMAQLKQVAEAEPLRAGER